MIHELAHKTCTCGHIKALHGSPGDRECRICRRSWTPSSCYAFQWRLTARLRRLLVSAG